MNTHKRVRKGSKLLRKGRLSWVGPVYFISTFIAQDAEHIDNQLCFDIIAGSLEKLEEQGVLFCETLVVMPDHLHMIVRLGAQKKIGQSMKLFKGRTAREINQQRGSTGSLWYVGYHDHLIRPDEPLQNFVNYIARNPVKKGPCKSPAEWPYLFINNKDCNI